MNDKQLIRFATQFRKGILGGNSSEWMCAAVSWPLSTLLAAHGVPNRIVEGDLGECNHVWLALEDGRVLDATADQFNWCNPNPLPPVYLGPPTVIHPTERSGIVEEKA